MQTLHAASLILVLSSFGGCATVPPQVVQLSTTVGNDLLAIRTSHQFYLNSYYNRLTCEANRAIDNDYTPALIRAALQGKSGQILMAKLEAGKQDGDAAVDAEQFVEEFVKKVKQHIDAQRARLVTPIEAAHSAALSQVDGAYAAVMQGNTTVTAYLDSLKKLRASQDQLLARVGLPNLQDKVGEQLSSVSDEIGSLLMEARTGEKKVDDAEVTVKKVLDDLQQQKGK